MGHLVNPLSLRLSVNSFWNSNWVLVNNYNYINIFKKDYELFTYLNWFLKKSNFHKSNILLSHYKIYRVYKRIYINLYIYDAESEGLNYKLISNIQKYYLLKKESSKNLSKKIKIYTSKFKNFVLTKVYSRIYKYIFKRVITVFFWTVMNFMSLRFLNLIKNQNMDLFFFNIYALNLFSVSVEAITSHISLRLQRKFSLNWVLFPVLKDLTYKVKSNVFLGYKLVCSGRFTRKQIATYTWVKKGSIKFNSVSNLIKYSETRIKLKYGLCGIKLWINYGYNNTNLKKRNLFLLYPIYIPFRYSVGIYKGNSYIIYHLNYWFFFFIKILFLKKKSFNLYKNILRIKIKTMILNMISTNYIKNNKYFNKLKLLTSNNKLKEFNNKNIIFKNYYKDIKKKIYNYKLLNKYSIFSQYKIVLLKYNKVMIINLNQNINYFKNIYKNIKI